MTDRFLLNEQMEKEKKSWY